MPRGKKGSTKGRKTTTGRTRGGNRGGQQEEGFFHEISSGGNKGRQGGNMNEVE
jgi:hypothetical protein